MFATKGILSGDSVLPILPFQSASTVIIKHLYKMITPLIRAQTAILMIDSSFLQHAKRKADQGHFISDVEIQRQMKRLSSCKVSQSKQAFQQLFESHYANPRYAGDFGFDYPLLGLPLAKPQILRKRLASQANEETKDDPVMK